MKKLIVTMMVLLLAACKQYEAGYKNIHTQLMSEEAVAGTVIEEYSALFTWHARSGRATSAIVAYGLMMKQAALQKDPVFLSMLEKHYADYIGLVEIFNTRVLITNPAVLNTYIMNELTMVGLEQPVMNGSGVIKEILLLSDETTLLANEVWLAQ